MKSPPVVALPVLLALAACGQSGPLVLPPEAAPPAPAGAGSEDAEGSPPAGDAAARDAGEDGDRETEGDGDGTGDD